MTLIPIETKPNEVRAALEEMKRGMDDQIKIIKLLAELRRAKYQAHIDQGFSEDQALELCKTISD